MGSNFLWKIIKIKNGCKKAIKTQKAEKQDVHYTNPDKWQLSKLNLPTMKAATTGHQWGS